MIDEAHRLLPSEWASASAELAGQTAILLLVTVHPEHVSPAVLRLVNILAVIDKNPYKSAGEFAKVIDIAPPPFPSGGLDPGEASVWFRDSNEMIERMECMAGKAERKRRRRKYAEGELDPERMFYFRGTEGKLNLAEEVMGIEENRSLSAAETRQEITRAIEVSIRLRRRPCEKNRVKMFTAETRSR